MRYFSLLLLLVKVLLAVPAISGQVHIPYAEEQRIYENAQAFKAFIAQDEWLAQAQFPPLNRPTASLPAYDDGPQEIPRASEMEAVMGVLRRLEESQAAMRGDIELIRQKVDRMEAERNEAIRLKREPAAVRAEVPERLIKQPDNYQPGPRIAEIDPTPGTSQVGVDYRYIVHPQTGIIVPAENEWISYTNPGGQARIMDLVRYKGRPVVLKSVVHGMIREPSAAGSQSSGGQPQQGLNMNFGGQ